MRREFQETLKDKNCEGKKNKL